jgi:hypothetical protein
MFYRLFHTSIMRWGVWKFLELEPGDWETRRKAGFQNSEVFAKPLVSLQKWGRAPEGNFPLSFGPCDYR